MNHGTPFTTRPKFPKSGQDHQHFSELRQQVLARVNQLPKRRLLLARIRAILLPLLYAAFYITALKSGSAAPGWYYFLFILMGLSAVLIFLNIIHDACHANLFPSRFWNRAFYYLFDFLGMNSFVWEKRHNILHHNYPNIEGWDSDIEQSPLFKIVPNGKPGYLQRYQHRFLFILYPLFLFNWIFIRDFKDYFLARQTVQKVCQIPRIELVKMLFFKLLFLFYMVGAPVLFFGIPFGQAVLAFLLLLGFGSVFALAVLLTPHANDGNAFPEAKPGEPMSNSWFLHQLVTTNDVSNDNLFTRWLMNNFNYHLSHHLFPNISSVYAPEVTAVIRQYAQAHRLPYQSYTFSQALKKHYRLIRNNAHA